MDGIELDSAVLFGLITMVSWGLWVVVGNAASESIDPRTAAAISYLVAAPLAVVYVVVSDASLAVTARGGMLAALAGLFTAVGFIATYAGLSVGSTTTVSTIGAMYFVVAAVTGAIIFGDDLTAIDVAGIAFAAIGVALIAR
ncbi:EamA family transporter [Natrarchaeobius chitinivorans]|uniref:EamA family transporter n=1 Tax=Natrarchaeobius chitinivorans TaxID=1679083 RepID=A0A3N6LV36_NATCH|nr:DMT family transporter [Natrarchaeobius chitinivorans]RQG94218.1 EamA family transporter [Natrarchaeobius chitinivorans]